VAEIVARLRKGEQFGLPAAGKHGTNQHGGVNNVNSTRTEGNNAAYAIRRLKRDRPDLFERVVAQDARFSFCREMGGRLQGRAQRASLADWWAFWRDSTFAVAFPPKPCSPLGSAVDQVGVVSSGNGSTG
jgi:hypothetical protein